MIQRTIFTFLFLTLIYPSLVVPKNAFSQEEALQIAKNRLASVKDRKKAIDQLQSNQHHEAMLELIEIIRNPEEAITIRGYVTQMLIESKDKWVLLELKKLLKDLTLPSETKKLALYALWRKDAQAMKPELISLAQNIGMSTDMRIAALTYLSQTEGNWPPEFWVKIYSQKSNPSPVRIAALNGMQEFNLLASEKIAILQVIQNPHEPTELRKSTILAAGRIFSSNEFERELISILVTPENSIEIKRFALDNLASNSNKMLIPQLKRILSDERNPVLSSELKTLIANLSTKN